ncbi:GyrI-like domain-containing protein [Aeromicrobium sp. P5_D10]
MNAHELTEDLTIAGVPLRTNNDVAMRTIPGHWEAFSANGGISQIADRISDDVFAVYTDFEHEGVDNTGDYTLVIGCRIAADEPVPPGLVATTVRASSRIVFPVERERSDLVAVVWQEIWSRSDLPKTFVADYEQYAPNGDIEISIGVRSPQ